MPAEQLEHQEQQLVLLEDEVFDFDDVVQLQQQQLLNHEPQKDEAAAAPPAAAPPAATVQQQQLDDGDAASREARDTRQMIASMLDQQPLMSVDTTPAAYLEYLRIIFNCARLLRQPAMPQDLRQSVTALLAKAKSLFCANAFSLIVQTVNAIGGGGGPPLPAFWGETFSQHEFQLWIELMETVFFFWSDSSDSDGLRARRRDDIIVEAFAVGLLDRLGELRAAYAGPPVPPEEARECGRRTERLARDIWRRLQPRHLLALARVKKADKALLPALAAFDCFLVAAGALTAASSSAAASAPTLARTKAALDCVTLEQARAALRLHRPGQFAACLPRMQRLRQRHLCRPELRESGGRRLRDLLGGGAALSGDPEVPEFLAAYVEYAAAASEFELRWQRAVVRDAAAIGPLLLDRLSSLVAKNIARAKSAGCWDSLSDELRADLQRQSERRLSALTAARPSSGDVPEERRNGRVTVVTFELDFASSSSTDFRPEFVTPQSPAVTAAPAAETATVT